MDQIRSKFGASALAPATLLALRFLLAVRSAVTLHRMVRVLAVPRHRPDRAVTRGAVASRGRSCEPVRRRHRVHAKLETVIVRKGQAMALTEYEKKILEQMEASLREEDPALASQMSSPTLDEDDNRVRPTDRGPLVALLSVSLGPSWAWSSWSSQSRWATRSSRSSWASRASPSPSPGFCTRCLARGRSL